MDCKVCKDHGMIPSCMICGRKWKKPHQTKLERIQKAALKDRIRLDQQAFDTFKKVNASGSGVESFDQEIREVIGDWKE